MFFTAEQMAEILAQHLPDQGGDNALLFVLRQLVAGKVADKMGIILHVAQPELIERLVEQQHDA